MTGENWTYIPAGSVTPAPAAPPAALPPTATPPPPADAIPTGVTNTEPIALVGAIQGVLIAVLAILTGFELVNWSQEEIGLILALYFAVSNALIAFGRAKAWSPASVAKLMAGKEHG